MRFRKLDREEHGRTKALYEQVFSEDEPSFVDYYYRCKASDNVIYAAEDEAGIHGMLHLNPYTVSWNGAPERIYYIVAVATEEAYRHQGIMACLLKQSLTDLHMQKVPFAFLMPASESIYMPFGFRRAWEWRWEEELLGDGAFSALPAEACDDLTLQKLSGHVNRELAARSSLFTWRTSSYYRNLAEEQAASGARLEILFRDNRPVSARCQAKEKFPPMMTRILNLESFLSQVRTREEKRCIWKVTDNLLEENNGIFVVTLTPGGGALRRLSEPSGLAEFFENPDCPEVSENESVSAAGRLRAASTETITGKTKICRDENGIYGNIRTVDISEIPQLLGSEDPFKGAIICEVV